MFSAFNPSKCTHLEQWAAICAAPGEQSWTSCRSRDSNPQPWVTSGFKSNALSTRPRLPAGLVSGFSPSELVFGHNARGPLKTLKEEILCFDSSEKNECP